MISLNVFECSLICTFLLVIWFKTDALIEYWKLIKFPKFLKIQEFLDAKEKDWTLEYQSYLLVKHNNFFTRLISCPICLGVWLSAIITFLFNHQFIGFFYIFIYSQLLYSILNNLIEYESK